MRNKNRRIFLERSKHTVLSHHKSTTTYKVHNFCSQMTKSFGKALRNVKAFEGKAVEVPMSIRYTICPNCKDPVPNLVAPCFSCGYTRYSDSDSEEEEKVVKEPESEQKSTPPKPAELIIDDVEILLEETKPKPLLERVIGIVFWIAWIFLFLGRPDIFQMKGSSVSSLDILKYTQLKAVDRTGYEQNFRQAFAVVGIPGEISRLNLQEIASFRETITNRTKVWVRKHKAKKILPKILFPVHLASLACALSTFVALNYPKFGSILFALSIFILYELLLIEDLHTIVLMPGWMTLICSIIASIYL